MIELIESEISYLREHCNFTEDELKVFNARTKGETLVAISISMCMSESYVSKVHKRVKEKVRRALPFMCNDLGLDFKDYEKYTRCKK